ncbi:hypothetical protein KJ570_00205, partial [Patescibacteria group bacterium]|nr:hypothetical protein [Patescibacteria group bacterium]
KEEIQESDNSKVLGTRIFERAAEVLIDLLPAYVKEKISLKTQNHKDATYTTLLKKENGFIPGKYLKAVIDGKTLKENWNIEFIEGFSLKLTPKNIERFIRAISPWPGAWTNVYIDSDKQEEKRLKIIEAKLIEEKLIPKTVQLEGKLEVTWKEFKKGYPNFSFS